MTTISCIYRETLTAKKVAGYMNVGYNESGTDTDAKYALKDYLGSPYVPTITGVLSNDAIKMVIDNNDPAYEKIKAATRVRRVCSFSFGDTSFSWKSTVKLLYN